VTFANSGSPTLPQTVSGLPSIETSGHGEDENSDTETDDQVAQSPSARSGTILPMVP
jgi:hypothetical protein